MSGALSEADFQAQVVELATLVGWRHCHVRPTVGRGKQWTTGTNVKGWPDLTLWHPERGRFLVVELKTDTGKLTSEQVVLLDELRQVYLDVRVWRPSQWDAEIVPTLRGESRWTT